MCSDSHGRLHALCQVPLNHVDDACLELERSMDNGHVGVHIGNHAGTKDLDDEGIVTFLQHAAALDAEKHVSICQQAVMGDELFSAREI